MIRVADTIQQMEADCGKCEGAAGALIGRTLQGSLMISATAPLFITEAIQLQNVVREAHQ